VGHEEAWEQWPLECPSTAVPGGQQGPSGPSPQVVCDDAATITIAAGSLLASVSKTSGLLTSLSFGGDELLAEPLVPNFWRAPTDNDYGASLQSKLSLWRTAGQTASLTRAVSSTLGGPSSIKVEADLAIGSGGAKLTLNYEVSSRGVRVSANFMQAGKAGVVLSGSVVYLLNKTSNKHFDVEGPKVSARWKDQGAYQQITLVASGKAAGEPLEDGDLVALQVCTGKTAAELLLNGIQAEPGLLDQTSSGLRAGLVAATGDKQSPAWVLRRRAGPGNLAPNDEVTFEVVPGHSCHSGWHLSAGNDKGAVIEPGSDGPAPAASFVLEVNQSTAPPRVGLTSTLAAGLEEVEWFGRGPHESYVDRRASARVGLHGGRIVDQTFRYIRPQENGNKDETRWMALKKSSAKGACGGLLLVAANPTPMLGMQCHRFALADFDGPEDKTKQAVRHGGELTERPETVICIDAAQNGVGGIDSWGQKPLEKHMVPSDKDFTWSFQLMPLSPEEAGAGSEVLSSLARTGVAARG